MYNEELHNIYASPNVIMVIKSRRIRGAEHVARIGKGKRRGDKCIKILFGKSKGKRPLGRTRRKFRITLKWILGNYGGKFVEMNHLG
jgi:hypothetical protein